MVYTSYFYPTIVSYASSSSKKKKNKRKEIKIVSCPKHPIILRKKYCHIPSPPILKIHPCGSNITTRNTPIKLSLLWQSSPILPLLVSYH